jgi:hypothetical protein
VLAGHLVWVFLGVSILHVMARPFFGKASRWMKASLNTYWVWWAIGGKRNVSMFEEGLVNWPLGVIDF